MVRLPHPLLFLFLHTFFLFDILALRTLAATLELLDCLKLGLGKAIPPPEVRKKEIHAYRDANLDGSSEKVGMNRHRVNKARKTME